MKVEPSPKVAQDRWVYDSCVQKIYPFVSSTLLSLGKASGSFVLGLGHKASLILLNQLKAAGREAFVWLTTDYTNPENVIEHFQKDPSRVIYAFLCLLRKNPKKAEKRLSQILGDYQENPEKYQCFTIDGIIESLLLSEKALEAKKRLGEYAYERDDLALADAEFYQESLREVNYFANYFMNTFILGNQEAFADLHLSKVKQKDNLYDKPSLTFTELFTLLAKGRKLEVLKRTQVFTKEANFWREKVIMPLRLAKRGAIWKVIDYFPRFKKLLQPAEAILLRTEILGPIIARLIGVYDPSTRKQRRV